MSHHLGAATLLDKVVRFHEKAASDLRQRRDECIRGAIGDGVSIGSVARAIGISKTYVLRIRDSGADQRRSELKRAN
jgi:hypothetical protein